MIIWDILRKSAENQRITYVRNAGKRDIFQSVAIPDTREVAPLVVSHTVSLRVKAGGVVVESRMFEILNNKTLNWGRRYIICVLSEYQRMYDGDQY